MKDLSDKKRKKKILKANNKISALYTKVHLLRESCQHNAATKTANSSTGGYDNNSDRYWYDCVCPVCGNTWRENQ